MMKKALVLATSMVWLACGVASSEQPKIEIPDWDNAVAFDVVFSQSPIRPGDSAELALMATIRPGYHLYGPEEEEPSKTVVSVESEAAEFGEVSYPAVIRRDLSGLGEFDLYEGEVAIRVPFTLSSEPGSNPKMSVDVKFQICTDYACSAPDSETISVSPKLGEAGAPVKTMLPDIFKKN